MDICNVYKADQVLQDDIDYLMHQGSINGIQYNNNAIYWGLWVFSLSVDFVLLHFCRDKDILM